MREVRSTNRKAIMPHQFMQLIDDFMDEMLENYPLSTLGQDYDGQLVIYTGLLLDPTDADKVIPFDEEDDFPEGES